MVQVTSAIALPKEDTEYEVVVRIGEKEIKTGKPAVKKHRYNRFNFRTVAPGSKESTNESMNLITFKAPYIDIADMGCVFIYLRGKSLLGSDKDICYYRMDTT